MSRALKKGQLVWLTGASSGIGEALALNLAQRGLRLILSARRESLLETLRSRLPQPEDVLVLPLDLNQPDTFEAATEKALKFGPIDWMIHNAGRSQRATAMDTSPLAERSLIETNFFGPIGLNRAVLPSMMERGSGHVVIISSVLGRFSIPLRTSYCASKHALHGYFNALRSEIAHTGVGITLVCPGYVATPLAQSAEWGSATPSSDPANDAGLTPTQCAEAIVKAMDKRKVEAHIGGKEILGIHLANLFPTRWSRYIAKMNRS